MRLGICWITLPSDSLLLTRSNAPGGKTCKSNSLQIWKCHQYYIHWTSSFLSQCLYWQIWEGGLALSKPNFKKSQWEPLKCLLSTLLCVDSKWSSHLEKLNTLQSSCSISLQTQWVWTSHWHLGELYWASFTENSKFSLYVMYDGPPTAGQWLSWHLQSEVEEEKETTISLELDRCYSGDVLYTLHCSCPSISYWNTSQSINLCHW
jgi:hypothetical protein